jgi:hypothetical protein
MGHQKKKTIDVRLYPGDIVLRKARPVAVGVPGMSDLIGWTKIQVTPDMVGKEIAMFTAVEVKTESVACNVTAA